MKPLAEQDHYEILEVSREAHAEEIERSYRLALSTYAEESLAGYSVFEGGESDALRERVEAAYRVLSDPRLRASYDDGLASRGREPDDGDVVAAAARHATEVVRDVERDEEGDLDEIDEYAGDFDGSRLRRTRLSRGFELEEIAGVTKVSPSYLRFIEEERFADLPAPVYVRGFVAAYASCVGLDARRVAASYMKRYREHAPKRG